MANFNRLPGPLLDNWDWQYLGSCNSLDTEMFFHQEGERGPARRRRAASAREICHACPVLGQCRSYALSTAEPYGVWGGLTEEERRSHHKLAHA